MRPLSIFNYYRNNLKKLLTVFIAVSLSVFLLYILQMIIYSSFRTEYQAFVEPQKYYSIFIRNENYIEEELVESIKEQKSTDYIMPFLYFYTNITYTFGETGTRILSLNTEDMRLLMSAARLKLIQGRFPVPGSDEIILHKLVAKNKGLKVGDKIGSSLNRKEVFVGEHKIVGIIDGTPIISFNSLESWIQTYNLDPYKYGLLVIPKKGRLDELNKYIDSLPYQGLEIRTLNSVTSQNTQSSSNIETLLTVINIIVITIVSLCVGFLCYIYFYQRRKEFGLLNAVGFTRQRIINRAFAEVSGINAAGFFAGILLALLCGLVLDILLFNPKGQLLVLWDFSYLTRVLCIPIFVSLFSVIPIWRMLKKLDPIAIIEGEA
jgi:ABC-type antimicrobial peptide transport system permease subunit